MPRRKKEELVETVTDGEVVGAVTEAVVEECPVSTDGETVVICCNYPCDIKFNVPDKNGRMNEIVFHGNAVNLRGKDKGILPVGAYGMTTGVPKEAWEWIVKSYPDFEPIKRGLIFASTAANARAEAGERSSLRHGFEPVNPDAAANSQPVE